MLRAELDSINANLAFLKTELGPIDAILPGIKTELGSIETNRPVERVSRLKKASQV